jgi:glucosamine 6-phosphate synthetase-like amidotransferase/phosphosugar isomerase protein
MQTVHKVKSGFTRTNILGYQVEIYFTRDGDTVHISKDGNEMYVARVCKGEALERAVAKVTEMTDAEFNERLLEAVRK